MIRGDTNNADVFLFLEKKFPKLVFFFFRQLLFGLQLHDELEQTLPSRLACKKMVSDPVGWSQGAQMTRNEKIFFY